MLVFVEHGGSAAAGACLVHRLARSVPPWFAGKIGSTCKLDPLIDRCALAVTGGALVVEEGWWVLIDAGGCAARWSQSEHGGPARDHRFGGRVGGRVLSAPASGRRGCVCTNPPASPPLWWGVGRGKGGGASPSTTCTSVELPLAYRASGGAPHAPRIPPRRPRSMTPPVSTPGMERCHNKVRNAPCTHVCG